MGKIHAPAKSLEGIAFIIRFVIGTRIISSACAAASGPEHAAILAARSLRATQHTVNKYGVSHGRDVCGFRKAKARPISVIEREIWMRPRDLLNSAAVKKATTQKWR